MIRAPLIPRTIRFSFMLFTAWTSFLSASLAGGMPPAPVQAEPVEVKVIQERRRVTGNLRPLSRSRVSAREEGWITEVLVREGLRVKKGAVLARMDTRRLDAHLAEVRAELEVAKANIKESEALLEKDRREYNRIAKIADISGVAKQDVDIAESVVHISEAKLKQTQGSINVIESRIRLLEVRLEEMVVRAPFDGHVIVRHTQPGEWIKPGDGVVTMHSVGRLEAWLDVPERLVGELKENLEGIGISIDAGSKTLKPVSARIMPNIDPRVRTFVLIALLEPKEEFLAAGMSVTAFVPTGKTGPKKLVSKDALIRDPTGFYVFKAHKGLKGEFMALPIGVKVLFETETQVAIESSELAEGDLVVVEGNERLRPMAPLSLLESKKNQTASATNKTKKMDQEK